MKTIIAALILSTVLASNAYAGCGMQPFPPFPPFGTTQCNAICVCDSSGMNCDWQFICR